MLLCLPSILASDAKIGSVAKARQSLENNETTSFISFVKHKSVA